MPSKKTGFSTISLPIELIEKIKQKINGTGFHSPSAYVTFVLRQILSETGEKNRVFSKEAEASIKGKLRSLGYI